MTASRDAYTTSAAHDSPDLRRRNVPAYDGSNGRLTRSYEETDDKKTQKVFILQFTAIGEDQADCCPN